MDLVGLLLIGVVLIFGSIYTGWVSWSVWQEARISVRDSKADGASVSASTWLQHGLTLLLSVVFLSVALSLGFSMAKDESCVAVMGQLRSLTASDSDYLGRMWGEEGNQGTLHIDPSSKDERITGASLAYIEFDTSDLKQLIAKYPDICWYILSGTQIDDQALRLLAEQEDLSALVLADTSITDRGLASFRGHRQLLELDLTRTAITDQSLQVVGSLPSLKHLNLSQTELTNDGLKALEGKVELFTLDIHGTQVSDEAVSTLATLRNLHALNVCDCSLSAAGIARLKRALPRCEIATPFLSEPERPFP